MITIKKRVHVVAAIIINDNNKILCAKRSPNMTLPNYWEFPGGKIEKGETKEEALKREIFEELSCTINVFQDVEDTTHEYEGIIVRLETYIARIVSGTPIKNEHAALKWLAVDQLSELHWAPADIPAVRKVKKLCKRAFTNK